MTMLANIHFVREKDTKIQYDYSIKVRLSPSKASREARQRLQLPYQCRALLDTLSLLDHQYGLFWIREPKMEFQLVLLILAGCVGIFLLYNHSQQQSPPGATLRAGTNHQSQCYQRIMLTKQDKLALNSSDPCLQSTTINQYISCLDQWSVPCRYVSKTALAIPGLLELNFTA